MKAMVDENLCYEGGIIEESEEGLRTSARGGGATDRMFGKGML